MRFTSIFLTIIFLQVLAGVPTTSAQNTTATSQLTGLTIDIGTSGEGVFYSTSPEPYEIDGYIQEDFEIWYQSAVIYVSFVQGDVSPQYWHDDSIASLSQEFNRFEVLQENVTASKSTAVFRGVYMMNYSILTYSEYQVGIAENASMSTVVHTGESTLQDDLDWAMSNITIGDQPFGQLADPAEVQSAIDGTSGIPPRVIPGYTSTQADWAHAGLISDTEWLSPHTGISISWDSQLWSFPYYKTDAIWIGTDYPEDYLTIVTPDQRGQTDILVYNNAEFVTPETWELYLTSSETIAGIEEEGFTVEIVDTATTENTASVIVKLTDKYGAEFLAIYDAYITPESTIVTHIFAAPVAIGDVYQAYWDGVKADGDFYPLTWTLEEIHQLADE